jgi:hypothetical protein
VIQDDPSKVLNPPERTDLHMLPLLEAAIGSPARELDLVSPYFVPTKEGTAALNAFAARGVKVRVLTNSLAATDVAPVHAGYAKYREDLLRGGVRLYGAMSNGWSFGANGEVEWTPYSTNNVDQLNHGDFDWDSHLLRKAEIYFDSKAYGKVWLGQGSMASESTAEADLSGTSVVGYSQVSDMAGGPFFRKDDGALSSVHVKDAFSNFDGVGRKLRARYDTPSFQGFSIAASVGTQIVPTTTDVTVWDVAARYDNTLGDYSVSGAVAFSKPADDQSLYDGSISILHDPTGLSITLAAATLGFVQVPQAEGVVGGARRTAGQHIELQRKFTT